jgi:proline dehydrogenase
MITTPTRKPASMPDFTNTEIAFNYRSNKELKNGRLLFRSMNSPAITRIGIAATKFSVMARLPVNWLIRKTIYKQFCGGETMKEVEKTSNRLAKFDVDIILDYGVEGKESESQFDYAADELVEAIFFASGKKNAPFVSMKLTGFARFSLLEKIHAGDALLQEEKEEWQRVISRVERICRTACNKGIMVLVDAEETWIIEPVNIITDLMMERYNKEKAIIFNTYQLYCHGTLDFLQECYTKAVSKGYILGAKLVRGAYMEKERARAHEQHYEDPIQPDKESTDRDYDAAVEFCLRHLDHIALFIGTHNERSCMNAVQRMKDYGIDPAQSQVYFSQLYGMGDNISFNLAYEGYQVSKYLPYGPIRDVIPYLMRRAQENTSVAGQTNRELMLIETELKRRAQHHH